MLTKCQTTVHILEVHLPTGVFTCQIQEEQIETVSHRTSQYGLFVRFRVNICSSPSCQQGCGVNGVVKTSPLCHIGPVTDTNGLGTNTATPNQQSGLTFHEMCPPHERGVMRRKTISAEIERADTS